MRSHSSGDVPATPIPNPVPTLSTSPSGAGPGSSDTARRQPSSVVTSATTTAALPPSSVMMRQVSSTAASSRSTQTTDAPSRAAPHGDRPAVADRRVRVAVRAGAGADHRDAPAGEERGHRGTGALPPLRRRPAGTPSASASALGSSSMRRERSTVVSMR